MVRKTKEPRIIGKIKREVAKEKGKKDQGKPISGDLGCSDSSGCTTYCSES